MRLHKRSVLSVEIAGTGASVEVQRHQMPCRSYHPTYQSLMRLLRVLHDTYWGAEIFVSLGIRPNKIIYTTWSLHHI